ncbi:hypothetical protein Hanom_Chr15g01410501 [Helianthus anomalus]
MPRSLTPACTLAAPSLPTLVNPVVPHTRWLIPESIEGSPVCDKYRKRDINESDLEGRSINSTSLAKYIASIQVIGRCKRTCCLTSSFKPAMK